MSTETKSTTVLPDPVFIETPIFGQGGSEFSDRDSLFALDVRKAPISMITWRAGQYVDCVQVHYRDGTKGGFHGRNTGTEYKIELKEGESIIAAEVRTSTDFGGVCYLKFTTDKGQSVGGGNAQPLTFIGEANAPDGKTMLPLAYIFGRKSAGQCHALGFGFQAEDDLPVQQRQVVGNIKEVRWPFSDELYVPYDFFAHPIKEIKVWADGWIRSIQVVYDNVAVQPQKHGNYTQFENVFAMNPAKEFITSVKVRADASKVWAVQFTTNLGRTSAYYGTRTNGDESTFDGVLLGLYGGALGDTVYNLGFMFGPAVEFLYSGMEFKSLEGPPPGTKNVSSITLTNNDPKLSQQASQQYSFSQSVTNSFTTEDRWKVGITVHFEWDSGPLGGASGGFSLSFDYERANISTASKTEQQTVTGTVNVTVPPASQVTASMVCGLQTGKTIPFSCKKEQIVRDQESGKILRRIPMGVVNGQWTGVSLGATSINYSQATPLSGTT